MSIIEQAKAELDRINFGTDDTIVMVDILERFFSQWDSGGAVSVAAPVLCKLLEGKPLAPLTGAADEWMDRTEMNGGKPLWQNVRASTVFKDETRAWDIDLPGDGTITFPYRPGDPEAWLPRNSPLRKPPLMAEGLEQLTDDEWRSPGNITYEPVPVTREQMQDIRDVAAGRVSPNEEFFKGQQWTPEQQAQLVEAQRDAMMFGIGVVEINRIPMSDMLDDQIDTGDIPEVGEEFFKNARLTKPGDLLARQQDTVLRGLDVARAYIEEQRQIISSLRAQLEAEGAHTEAANSRIDELTAQQYRAPKAQSDG